MASSRIILNGQELINLMNDTVTAGDVRTGVTFHDAKGNLVTGTLVSEDGIKYIEFAGVKIYKDEIGAFSIDKITALTALGLDEVDAKKGLGKVATYNSLLDDEVLFDENKKIRSDYLSSSSSGEITWDSI